LIACSPKRLWCRPFIPEVAHATRGAVVIAEEGCILERIVST